MAFAILNRFLNTRHLHLTGIVKINFSLCYFKLYEVIFTPEMIFYFLCDACNEFIFVELVFIYRTLLKYCKEFLIHRVESTFANIFLHSVFKRWFIAICNFNFLAAFVFHCIYERLFYLRSVFHQYRIVKLNVPEIFIRLLHYDFSGSIDLYIIRGTKLTLKGIVGSFYLFFRYSCVNNSLLDNIGCYFFLVKS